MDGAYAVHDDMKSHSGCAMTMGRGSLFSGSTKQKINTRSSTEAELVAVHDYMPQALWSRYFLQDQGYEVPTSRIMQDNTSAMLLERNGRRSSGKKTRHIDIRYFFIKDRIEGGEVDVEWCPTDQMIADFFTKPLQGSSFIKMRDYILNHNPRK